MIRLTPHGDERRRHTRTPIVRAAKVRRERSIRYAPGETVNLSSSGALLRFREVCAIAVGDPVEVVVAWDREAVLPRAGALTGTVRRIEAKPDAAGCDIAVEFDRPALSVASKPLRVAPPVRSRPEAA